MHTAPPRRSPRTSPSIGPRMLRHPIVCAAALLLVVGCAHVETPRFYTLDMSASGKAASAYDIRIDRIRPFEPLMRSNILIKTSPTEIEYYALDQWAANLGELVAQKLAAEFAGDPAGRPVLMLTGTVLAFEQVECSEGCKAMARLEIAVREETAGRHDAPLLSKTYEAVRPAGNEGVPGLVRGLSACLEDIAAQIVRDLPQAKPTSESGGPA